MADDMGGMGDMSGMPGMSHDMSGMGHDMGHMHHSMTDMASMPGMDMSAHVAMFRRRFWIMLVLAVPTVAFSPMFASLLGYPLPGAAWVSWVSPVIGTVIFLWGGWPFLTGAVDEIRDRKPAMMLLIGLAITTAFLASWAASLGLVAHSLDAWWELATLVVIMLAGHWIEMRSLARTSGALDSLAALMPDTAERLDGGDAVTVAVSDLRVDDVVLVRPGATVPADGRVVDGEASVDESMITGESRPVRRGAGQDVTAGTIATDSGLRVRVTATGEDTALAGIRRMVAQAQSSSTRAQRLADRAAGWLFWFALGSAVVTALVWSLIGMPDRAVERAVTVLIIACPHALGLAIPLVVSLATGRAAGAGILVKDRMALETMKDVDVVLFDKTGTLTSGHPQLERARSVDDVTTDELLRLAAAAESASEHPLARAIVAAARDHSLDVPPATEFSSSPAVGVTATVEGAQIRVGGPRLLAEEGAAPLPVAQEDRDAGAIILHVLRDGSAIGALRLADAVRPQSHAAIESLRRRGVESVIVTGDADQVASGVARGLGIQRYFAGVRPEEKAARVAELQAEGHRVAMVGDGVNDAPALAKADVGMAIGAGTDVAIASAGVILSGDDPRSVVSVIELSRATYRKMRQNLWWAAGYNIIAVPLAAGVLAPVGFLMPMSVGAILMSASTVIVAANAQTLRRLDLHAGAARA